MSKNTYSLSAAARITGKTRDTIRAHIKKKKISTMKDINGNRRIEASELMRVYGTDLDFSLEEQRNGKTKKKGTKTGKSQSDDVETKHLQARLEQEQQERSKERERHDDRIEELLKALATSQENHNKTLRLQDQSSGSGDWQQALKELKSQIVDEQTQARREIQEMKELAKRREEKLRRALEAERNKSFWQKIWK